MRTAQQLARLFRDMYQAYRYLGPPERFRARAYQKAWQLMSQVREPLEQWDHDARKWDRLQGIGESLSAKIIEYMDTGRILAHDKLLNQVPLDLLPLMEEEGIGPATLRTLHDKLHLHTREALRHALRSGKLNTLRGFGPKKIQRISQAVQMSKENAAPRRAYMEALPVASSLLKQVAAISGVLGYWLAGSLRRKRADIGDIDVVVSAAPKDHGRIAAALATLPGVETCLSRGKTKVSVRLAASGMQADFRIVEPDSAGSALQYFTGSKAHNRKLRALARNAGYKMNEYGLFRLADGKKMAGRNEADMYRLLGWEMPPPEQRLGETEFRQLPENKPERTDHEVTNVTESRKVLR